MSRLIVIDPILRGSRLHYTQLAANGLTSNYNVVVLGRRGEVFEGEGTTYYGVFVLPESFWYGRVGFFNFLRLAKFLFSLKCIEDDRIYFSGLNEWMPWFVLVSLILRVKKIKTVAIDYEGKYWVEDKNNNPRKILGRLSRKALTWMKAVKIGILDERAPPHASRKVFFIPDPPIFNKKYEEQKFNKTNPNKVSFLTFGVQSERKGIRLLEELVSNHADVLVEHNIFIKCIGVLGEEVRELEERLRLSSGNGCFEWIPEYISEERLEEEASKVDFILLPYHPMFEGSSGILAHACLWGRPILATTHGVVGYRVKRFFLGDVFNYDIPDFIERLVGMRRELAESDCYLRGRAEFLDEFSEKKHLEILDSALSKW